MATKKKLKKPAPNPEVHNNTVSNCEFSAVKWDAQALGSIQTVAQALLNLTELFKIQDIKIDAMIKVEADRTTIANSIFRDNSKSSK